MKKEAEEKPENLEEKQASTGRAEDITGRDRIVINVLSSWGAHFIFIVSGFIVPRMISSLLNKEMLGIWDLAWSLVNSLNYAGLGVGSAVNRYVAKYRAQHNIEELRKTVSSVMCIQVCIALVILVVTSILIFLLPELYEDSLLKIIENQEAIPNQPMMTIEQIKIDFSWVIGFLGFSLMIIMGFDFYRGVITGCHRWDIHNAIHASGKIMIVIVWIVGMLMGGGLRTLSVVYFIFTVITEFFRAYFAFRVCPDLKLSFNLVSLRCIREMLAFGMKTVVASISPLVLIYTSKFIVGTLSMGSLALFSRPIALVTHVETIMNKFGFILTPTTGSLQGKGLNDEVRKLFIVTTRYGIALTLPLVLFLSIYADFILEAWMGKEFAVAGTLLVILALGYFLPIAQSSVMRILMGLNLHGKIGLVSVCITVTSYCTGAVVVSFFEWTIVSTGILIAVSLTLSNGLFVPICACRKLGIPYFHYLLSVFPKPASIALIYGGIIYTSRVLWKDNQVVAFFAGNTVGGIIILLLYWHFLLPKHGRKKIINKILRKKDVDLVK